MKNIILSIIALLSLTGCKAAETNNPVAAKPPKSEIDSWANVPGGVIVRRITNAEPTRYEQLKSNSNVFVTTEYVERVYQAPIQIVQWYNDISNVWETVEFPLIQPRLISETLRTNVVTNAK